MLTKGHNFKTQMNSQKTQTNFWDSKENSEENLRFCICNSSPNCCCRRDFWVISSLTLLNPFPRSFRGLGHNIPESSCCISTCNAIQERGCQSSCWCLLSHLCSLTPRTLILIYIHGILKSLQKASERNECS